MVQQRTPEKSLTNGKKSGKYFVTELHKILYVLYYNEIYHRNINIAFCTLGGSSAVTPESEFADREVSYDEVAAVTAHVRIQSNHLSPMNNPGVFIPKSEDVADSVFSMEELTSSGLLAGECTGTGIVSIRGTKGERPLSSHFPLNMPGLNTQNNISDSSDTCNMKQTTSKESEDVRKISLPRINNISLDSAAEKATIKSEDYGFQVLNIGSGKEIKIQIDPTKQYFKYASNSKDMEISNLLLPGDQLLSINGTDIKSDQLETKQRKRERHPRPDARDRVLNVLKASENKDVCHLQVTI